MLDALNISKNYRDETRLLECAYSMKAELTEFGHQRKIKRAYVLKHMWDFILNCFSFQTNLKKNLNTKTHRKKNQNKNIEINSYHLRRGSER